jgi:acetyl esterase/lipase
MLVFAGGAEMLLDDSRRLAEHAVRDAVSVELVIEDEMMHVWPAIADWEPATARTLAAATRWIESIA